jgi:hypothetical protein
MSKTSAQTYHSTHGKAVATIVVVLPIHSTTIEVQVVGVLNITAVK